MRSGQEASVNQAHNPHAADALAAELAVQSVKTWCVLGMLKDKDNAL